MPLIEKGYFLIEGLRCPHCGGTLEITKDISNEEGTGFILKCFGTCGHEFAMNADSGLVRDNTVVFPKCQKSKA